MHHTRSGHGQPLVLIHGLGGSHSVWDPILDTVTREREAITLDLPGFGRSPELLDRARPTPARLALAVAELCRELALERPHAAGVSLGGWIALELAKLDAVASVAGFSPAGLWREPLGPRRFELHGMARAAKPLLGAVLATRRGRALMLRNTVVHPERIPPATARQLVIGWLDSPAYAATSREMRGAAFEHQGLVQVPVTLAWAERDRVVSRPGPERVPPGTRQLVLAGCGHIPTWDDPGQVARTVLEASSAG